METIILVGFMGCGKTTFGRKLAKKLKYDFIDSDALIEEQENMKISDIFKEKGEEYFRSLEKLFIQTLENKNNKIVATGGGMPCFEDNMEKLNQVGLTIYLKRPTLELVYRLLRSKKERPLTKEKQKEELKVFINNLIEKREKYYLKSKFILEREQIDVDYIVKMLHDNGESLPRSTD
jgi:shikimate kinase